MGEVSLGLAWVLPGENLFSGSRPYLESDVRIIVAANVDLRGKTKDGSFRKDLSYRLRVVPLALLPLKVLTFGSVIQPYDLNIDCPLRKNASQPNLRNVGNKPLWHNMLKHR
ncbi:MAG: sigma 54-interacting transcriptional regulator [bacterium]